jgi:uncharacterized protein YgfB (UPF0149 family)
MQRISLTGVPHVSDLTALALNAADRLSVEELHGAVCGLAVCFGDDLPLQDLVELVGVDALTDERAVARFVAAALAELEADDMRFAPLLPDDDAALVTRVRALGQWCGSFLAGLAAGLARRGVNGLDEAPEEVREIVEDFSAIARVDADQVGGPEGRQAQAGGNGLEGGDEQDEADFLELHEFVKVGVLLIMSVLRGDGGDSAQ